MSSEIVESNVYLVEVANLGETLSLRKERVIPQTPFLKKRNALCSLRLNPPAI